MTTDVTDRLRRAYAARADRVPDLVPPLDEVGVGATGEVPPRRLVHRRVPALVAATIALGAVAWVGYAVLEAVPREGAFNPGQPLHCSGIQTMVPAAAERELEERGYAVRWQYHPEPGSAAIRGRPPAGAVVVDIAIVDGGTTALVLAEGFDAQDPLHARLRAGETQCDRATSP